MNIGIFTDTYYPQVNGVVTSIRTLEKELNKKGHKVYIFTITHPDARKAIPRVFRLPSMPFVFLPSHRVGLLYSPKAITMIKKLNLDLIHTQTEFSLGLFGKYVSKHLHLPNVHTYHTMYEDYVHYITFGKKTKITPKMARGLSRIFCNKSNRVIAPTEKVKDILKSYKVQKPIEAIPTGINLEPFKKENFDPKEIQLLREKFHIQHDDPVILFVGRLAKEKSIDVIIKAMPNVLQQFPTAKLLIIGDGPEKKYLEGLSTTLEIQSSIIFAGQQPWNMIGEFYQLGSIFVSASVTETQGLTFAEAMAGKIPVVAKYDKNLEGMLENNKTGKIFYHDNELSSILCELIADPFNAQQMAQNAYIAVQQYSSTLFGERVIQLYEEVLAENKR